MMQKWRTPVQVEGRTRRDADGYLVQDSAARLIPGCLIAPGAFTVPGLLESPTSEQPDRPGHAVRPAGRAVRGRRHNRRPACPSARREWQVESKPAPWPRGVAVTIKRR